MLQRPRPLRCAYFIEIISSLHEEVRLREKVGTPTTIICRWESSARSLASSERPHLIQKLLVNWNLNTHDNGEIADVVLDLLGHL